MTKITEFIVHVIGNIFSSIFIVKCWYTFLNNKKINTRKFMFLVLLISITISIFSVILPQSMKMIFAFIALIIISYIFVTKNITQSTLIVISSQVILWISEFIIVGVILLSRNNNIEKTVNTPAGFIFLNFGIMIISIIILNLKISKNIYSLINKISETISKNELIRYLLIIMLTLFITTLESYKKLPLIMTIVINMIMGAIFITIVIRMTITKSSYNKINNKYQMSINSLKEYETMIDKFRVVNHENKNELLTIRNMIKNKDKKTVEYIDKLVDNKIKDNEKIMYQTSKIPEGGLRATIYSKLCVMDKNKIEYKLDISKDVRTVDLINLDEELILNICKILGVFMDNAIEEVKNNKEKKIDIELYVIDKSLFIDITNNYNNKIELSKMGHESHTTKGKEHGYGLLLVNKIISENQEYLENEKSIKGNRFTQSLIIKL